MHTNVLPQITNLYSEGRDHQFTGRTKNRIRRGKTVGLMYQLTYTCTNQNWAGNHAQQTVWVPDYVIGRMQQNVR